MNIHVGVSIATHWVSERALHPSVATLTETLRDASLSQVYRKTWRRREMCRPARVQTTAHGRTRCYQHRDASRASSSTPAPTTPPPPSPASTTIPSSLPVSSSLSFPSSSPSPPLSRPRPHRRSTSHTMSASPRRDGKENGKRIRPSFFILRRRPLLTTRVLLSYSIFLREWRRPLSIPFRFSSGVAHSPCSCQY